MGRRCVLRDAGGVGAEPRHRRGRPQRTAARPNCCAWRRRPSAAGKRRKPTNCWSAPKPASSWCVPAAASAGRPAGGEPAQHIAEARRALAGRDRAEAMRHTNLAIATTRDANSATGSDAGPLRRPRRRRRQRHAGIRHEPHLRRRPRRGARRRHGRHQRHPGRGRRPRPGQPRHRPRRRRWHRHNRPAARRHPPRLVRHPRRGRAGSTRRLRDPAPRSDAGPSAPIPALGGNARGGGLITGVPNITPARAVRA